MKYIFGVFGVSFHKTQNKIIVLYLMPVLVCGWFENYHITSKFLIQQIQYTCDSSLRQPNQNKLWLKHDANVFENKL